MKQFDLFYSVGNTGRHHFFPSPAYRLLERAPHGLDCLFGWGNEGNTMSFQFAKKALLDFYAD